METAYYKNLIKNNIDWAAERLEEDGDYFSKLSAGQTPKILWIGCSDSRVPESNITKSSPGDIFVHRNIANMVVHTDMNMLSVLDYAVNVLMVDHVIVCGHYGCGGVRAAMNGQQFGLIDNWIRNIKDVYRHYQDELDAIEDFDARFKRLVECNVQEQVFDLSKTSIIQNSWEKRRLPIIHGWVFDISTGLIKDLHVNVRDNNELAEVYRFSS